MNDSAGPTVLPRCFEVVPSSGSSKSPSQTFESSYSSKPAIVCGGIIHHAVAVLLLVLKLSVLNPRVLGCGHDRGGHGSGNCIAVGLGGLDLGRDHRRRLPLWALSRDVTGLATVITSLAGNAQRTSARGRALLGNMTKLAAGIALHGLRLTIPSEVVGPTALVASGRSWAAGVPTTAVTAKAATADRSATATKRRDPTRIRAVALCGSLATRSLQQGMITRTYGQMTLLVAVVATAGPRAAQAERRAVRLHMAQALTMIALLRLRSPRQRALVGLVTWLFACACHRQ